VIESLTIDNLRGIRSGAVDNLAAINVVVGPNNSGKSTVLEALLLLVAIADPGRVLQALLARGGEPLVAIRQIAGDASKAVRVTARLSSPTTRELLTSIDFPTVRTPHILAEARAQGMEEPFSEIYVYSELKPSGGQCRLGMALSKDGHFTVPSLLAGQRPALPNVGLVALLAPRDLETEISRIGNVGGLKDLTRALAVSLPGLADLRIQKLGERFVTHAFVEGKEPIPAYLLGDGAKRLIEIAAMVFAKPDTTILLEEPEAFQHPRYLREIVNMIGTFAERGAQYVLTTHSIELIDALLDEVQSRGDKAPSLAVHRTRLLDGELKATTLDAATARRLRSDLLEDLRG